MLVANSVTVLISADIESEENVRIQCIMALISNRGKTPGLIAF